MTPIDAEIVQRAVGAEFDQEQKDLDQELRELRRAHFSRSHREFTMMDRFPDRRHALRSVHCMVGR